MAALKKAKGTVKVRLAGKDYRVKSDADPAWLQKVANQVDETMELIRKRTGAVDSLEVALLAALNLARELTQLRDSIDGPTVPDERLRALIELAEGAIESTVQSATTH